MIPYGKQLLDEDDINAVIEVLRSDFLTQGPFVPKFESAVSDYSGASHAVAVNSATSALHIACLALEVGKGDIVWTSPISFVASANCALYCGAEVDFVDIDPETYNLSIEDLKKKLELAERIGQLPKVVIPVHLSGQPCDMAAIYDLSKKYHFKIIEDASHAIGGHYNGKFIGSCLYSDITVFSFHPVKIITTGEGGMALTNNARLADQMRLLRSHGITRSDSEMAYLPDGPWYYEQQQLGFNYRMTDIQATLGCSQLNKINSFVARRHVLAGQYEELLKDLPIKLPRQHPSSYSAFHLYIIRLRLDSISSSHKEVFQNLINGGIGVNLHYIPIYRQPYYRGMGFQPENFPEAESYYSEAITLPIYPALSDQQQVEVVNKIRSALI